MSAAAALGMNLSTTASEVVVQDSRVPTSVVTQAGTNIEGIVGAGGGGSGNCAAGNVGTTGSTNSSSGTGSSNRITTEASAISPLMTTRGRAQKQRLQQLLSESSQTSGRKHVVTVLTQQSNTGGDSSEPAEESAVANNSAVNTVLATAANNTAATSASSSATPAIVTTTTVAITIPSEGSASANNHPEGQPADQEEAHNTKMIDASDFRMVDPGCSYTTLAAAAAANGRMTPPNHHGGHHQGPPHHGLHPSHHAMASYVNTSYTTLTPLQPLPPISTISSMQDKFQAYSPSANAPGGEAGATPTHASEAGGPPTVSVSNFVMQNNLSPYMSMSPPHYAGSHAAAAAAIAMGAHSPPHEGGGAGGHHYSHNGGSGIHSKQEPLSPNSYYAEAQRPSPHHDMSPHSLDHSPTGGSNGGGPASMVPTSNYDPLTSNNNPSLNGGMTSPHTISPVPHTSPLLHHRELSPPSPPPSHHGNNGANILAAAAASALGHHNQHAGQGMMPIGQVTLKSAPTSNNNNTAGGGTQGGGAGEAEEINTKDLAQRISAELKRYSIPQAIFAQRVLCRSQGTLSDLLRNPKPWSKLKSGRETFRRMQKWLSEPEFQRMSALRLAGKSLFFFKLLFVYFYIRYCSTTAVE